MNEKTIEQYCKQVGKLMLCNKPHKKELLLGLKQELLDKYNSQLISFQHVVEQVGTPDSVAEQLQSTIDTTEYEKAIKQKRKAPFLLVVFVLIILSVITAGYLIYWEKNRIASSSTVIVYENEEVTVPYDEEEIIWGPVVTDEATEGP